MSWTVLFYIAGSAAAIGLLAMLLHRLGHSTLRPFADDKEAEDIFLQEYPDAEITGLDLSVDKCAALMELSEDGRFGLARAMGANRLARLVLRTEIAQVDLSGAVLRLHLRDFADPLFTIQFATEETAARWRQLLKGGPEGPEQETS